MITLSHRISTLLCAINAFLTVAAHAALPDAHQTWTPELQAAVKVPTAVHLSPDGTRVAYSVSDAVMTSTRSIYVAQIHVAGTDGKSHVQLTSGEASSTNAKWSPDGKSIAYLSRRNGHYNIFLHSLASSQARQLSNFKTGVIGFAWSPDSRHMALVANDGETTQEEQDAKGRNDAYWRDEAHKMGRLYLLDVETGSATAPRLLTDGKRNVTREFDWSPDGRRIAFTHEETPEIDGWKSAQVSVVHVQNGLITDLMPTVTGLSQPHFSPDGRWIAVRASHLPARYPEGADIVLLASDGGQTKTLPLTTNADPTIVRWSSDGKRLYFSEATGTRTDTNYIDIEQGQIVALQQEPAVLSALDVSNDGQTLAFVMQTTQKAPEVYTSATTPFAPVRVSNVNADTLQLAVGKTELIRWKSRDGTEIEGLLTYPTSYVAGTRVPFLLNIHGGPDSLFSQNYIAGRGNFPIASLSARGYAVLRANPRGSGGYGTAFRARKLQLWGGEDYYDLMSGVDHVIGMGVANPDRLGVFGWSYGGAI